MPIRMQPAKFPHGEVPDVLGYVPEATEEFLRGCIMQLVTGEVIIHPLATLVTDVTGVALCGTSAAGVSESPSGEIQVARAAPDQIYLGQMVAGGVDADVVLTDLSSIVVGTKYGAIINTAGEHMVDFSDTTNVILTIEKVDDNLDIVWFKFLASALVAA